MQKIMRVFGLLSFFVATLSLNLVTSANEVNSSLMASGSDVTLGQEVRVSLEINATENNVLYTTSANLKYDTEMLDLVDIEYNTDWLFMSPDEILDEQNGLIRETAGFPGGIATSSRQVTFVFKTKKIGIANIELTNGMALNIDSEDRGLTSQIVEIDIR